MDGTVEGAQRLPGRERRRWLVGGHQRSEGPPLPHPRVRQTRRSIRKQRTSILAAIEHGLSNGRIESP